MSAEIPAELTNELSVELSTNRLSLSLSKQGIAYVKLNRPDKMNALDMAMFKDIQKAQKTIRANRDIRVVILSGEGSEFCSGLDVKSVMRSTKNAIALLFKWLPGNSNLAQKVSEGWAKLPVPVIAAIHGRCWGGGLQVALGADFRICAPDASLSVMEAHWGLIPDMAGNKALSRIMPIDQALKLAMSAQHINGEQALELGLVTEVSDSPALAAEQFAKTLITRSPDVLAAVKKLYYKHWHNSERSMLATETGYQLKILSGKNQRIATKMATGNDDVKFAPRKSW